MNRSSRESGYFVLSLDLELFWGVRDQQTLAGYGLNIRGVHEMFPSLLGLFEKYHIKATFAVVGFLFFQDRSQLLENLPTAKPSYLDSRFSPYGAYLTNLGNDREDDPYHFGDNLISQLQASGHEIGSHTFSHYYCLEQGQTPEQFRHDLLMAKKVAEGRGLHLLSLVFPRNQYGAQHLSILKELGFTSYRGTEKAYFYASIGTSEYFCRSYRALRLIDSYLNLSGYNTYSPAALGKGGAPYNLPASRMLRPYSRALSVLEPLRLQRICRAMSHAARSGEIFHLWWHPHNFGINQNENLAFLEKIFLHYRSLTAQYGFCNHTMTGLANMLAENIYE